MDDKPKAAAVAVPDRGGRRTPVPTGQPGGARLFPPTRWTLLIGARAEDPFRAAWWSSIALNLLVALWMLAMIFKL